MNLLIKDIPFIERPRERLKRKGVEYLTNEELLAILLRTGTKDTSVKDLALKILQTIEHIKDLNNLTLNHLLKIKGIGEAKAMSILCALELGKRIYLLNENKDKIKISNGQVIYDLFSYLAESETQENLIVVLLDTKNYVIKYQSIFKGSLNMSIAHPREIFKFAMLNSAASLIIVHNHPSGDATPSKEDEQFTKQIFKTGQIVGINVIDHIIIGKNNYYTFKENKMVMV